MGVITRGLPVHTIRYRILVRTLLVTILDLITVTCAKNFFHISKQISGPRSVSKVFLLVLKAVKAVREKKKTMVQNFSQRKCLNYNIKLKKNKIIWWHLKWRKSVQWRKKKLTYTKCLYMNLKLNKAMILASRSSGRHSTSLLVKRNGLCGVDESRTGAPFLCWIETRK